MFYHSVNTRQPYTTAAGFFSTAHIIQQPCCQTFLYLNWRFISSSMESSGWWGIWIAERVVQKGCIHCKGRWNGAGKQWIRQTICTWETSSNILILKPIPRFSTTAAICIILYCIANINLTRGFQWHMPSCHKKYYFLICIDIMFLLYFDEHLKSYICLL